MCSLPALFINSTDRRSVFVNLRTHIPDRLLQLNGETRLVQATNNYNKLKVYLYFSEPVLNSSAEIINTLQMSQGTLLPVSGTNLGNRRFGFTVSWFSKSFLFFSLFNCPMKFGMAHLYFVKYVMHNIILNPHLETLETFIAMGKLII